MSPALTAANARLETTLGEIIARTKDPTAAAEADKDGRIYDLEATVKRLRSVVEDQQRTVVAARAKLKASEAFLKEKASLTCEMNRLRNLLRKAGVDPDVNLPPGMARSDDGGEPIVVPAPKPPRVAKVDAVYAPDALSASSQKRLRAMFPDFYAAKPEPTADQPAEPVP